MTRKINLTIATDVNGMGGISTVLSIYKSVGFFYRHNIKLIETHSGLRKFGIFSFVLLYLSALLKIIYYQQFYKVEIAHVHMASRGSYLRKSLIIRWLKFFKIKVILHLHGAEFRDFYAQECSQKKQQHIRDTFIMSDAVIVLSSQWISWAQETFSRTEHIRVVYNAVPVLELERTDVQSGLIAFFGRISQRKGVSDLIQAMSLVIKKCPNARLKLAGDGDIAVYKEQVEKLDMQEYIEFLGWVSGKEKENLLSISDVYCLPSYNEGFPMGVIEAMSAGIPVVSSFAGGIPDAITHNKEGLLVEAGDINGVAEALINIIENRELNEEFAKAAKSKFKENFSTEVIIPQLDKIYSELLSKED